MMRKKKDFDCIEMQDRAALRIHETLKGKTKEEVLAYWRERGEEARVRYPELRDLDLSVARKDSVR